MRVSLFIFCSLLDEQRRETMEGAGRWIVADETAKTMLQRVTKKRDACLSFTRNIPPFRRVRLVPRNVVEIVGPSGSAKSELLTQVVVNCVLPKEWKGVTCGGSERAVMFFDLDNRFDLRRLSNSLKSRIHGLLGHSENIKDGFQVHIQQRNNDENDLMKSCMERFLYMRCYSSLELLAALKTVCPQIQKENKKHGKGVCLLMIDSIGAFYWLDRAYRSNNTEEKRKKLSFQVIWEAVVQELHFILQLYPLLVLVTKPSITANDSLSTRDVKRVCSESSHDSVQNLPRAQYREYMPAVWQTSMLTVTPNNTRELTLLVFMQTFVTHRLFLEKSEETKVNENRKLPIFTSTWDAPALRFVEKFIVQDDGLSLIC